jgi:hypothetical protein
MMIKTFNKSLSKQDQQAAVNAWLLEHIEPGKPAVFMTLKFRHKFNELGHKDDIAPVHAQRLLRIFLRKLDCAYFSERGVRKGLVGITRFAFLHMGSHGDNVHFHVVARPHVPAEQFANVAAKHWASLDKHGWIDVNHSRFDVVGPTYDDIKNVMFYAAKEVRKLGADESWLVFESYIQKQHLLVNTP